MKNLNFSYFIYSSKIIFTSLFFCVFFLNQLKAQTPLPSDSLKVDSLSKSVSTPPPVLAAPASEPTKSSNKAESTTSTKSDKGRTAIDSRSFRERIDFDVNTSFWINSKRTFFEFSPTVSYGFLKRLSIGVGPAYVYNRDRVKDVNLNGWGGKVFGRADLTKWLYAYTEYQGLNNQYISGFDNVTNEVTKDNQYVESWFLSAGINIRISKRRGFNLQALYDVLYDKETSAYFNPWTFRVGFGF